MARNKDKMNKQKRKTITTTLSIIGFILVFIPFVKYLKPLSVTYQRTTETATTTLSFTGIDGTILTIGIVLLLFTYFFYHKKLPWFK